MKRRTFMQLLMSLPFLTRGSLSAAKGVTMITHLSNTRGYANHGWLQSHHTFSFANYYDPSRMGFGALRVINDDIIAGGRGFGMHPHRDMEIITIPLKGILKHEDSEGNSSDIKKGEVQIMSAGTGILHSEHNAQTDKEVTLLQIWVLPKKMSVKPRYEQKAFEYKSNAATLVVSPDGREGSVSINQDAYFSFVNLDAGKELTYDRKQAGNGVYIFVISGEAEIDGRKFSTRDGIGIPNFSSLEIKAEAKTEILFMEIPMAVAQ